MKNITGNSLVIKEVNINLVRNALKEMGQATKQQLAAATGLSTVTVGTMLQQLIAQKEAFETELSSSSGGRPAHQFKYNPDYAHALIIFPFETNGVINIHSAIVNLLGDIIYTKDWKASKVDLSVFESIIDELLEAYPDIEAIGFGLPGAEYDGKMIVSDYKALLGISIVEHFSSKYKRTVIIENDVNAAVIGYAKRKLSMAEAVVVYIFFPGSYPPGAGIFINGKLHKGKGNFAGEISNIPLGIDWTDEALYKSFNQASEAIAKLITAVSSVINPGFVVLHGDFLTIEHIAKLSELCSTRLPGNAVPEIHLSENFTEDYLHGMIVQTLKTLDSNLVLSIS